MSLSSLLSANQFKDSVPGIERYACPLEQLNFSAIPWPGARQGMEEDLHGFPASAGCQSRKVRGALSQLILSLEGELANLPNGG